MVAVPPAPVIDDPAAAFVEPPEPTIVKVDVPEPIVDGLEADVLLDQGVAHGDPVLLPADSPVPADEADLVVAGILRRPEARGHWARGRPIHRGGGPLPEGLVRALLVIEGPPVREPDLLRAAGGGRGPGSFGLEGAVQAFVPRILFRMPGLDEFGPNAQLDPPDRERREAREGLPSEGL